MHALRWAFKGIVEVIGLRKKVCARMAVEQSKTSFIFINNNTAIDAVYIMMVLLDLLFENMNPLSSWATRCKSRHSAVPFLSLRFEEDLYEEFFAVLIKPSPEPPLTPIDLARL